MESDSEAEEDDEEEVVEVEPRPSSLNRQDRVIARRFEQIQVSHFCNVFLLLLKSKMWYVKSSLNKTTSHFSSDPCPVDGAKRVPYEARRRAEGQTEG